MEYRASVNLEVAWEKDETKGTSDKKRWERRKEARNDEQKCKEKDSLSEWKGGGYGAQTEQSVKHRTAEADREYPSSSQLHNCVCENVCTGECVCGCVLCDIVLSGSCLWGYKGLSPMSESTWRHADRASSLQNKLTAQTQNIYLNKSNEAQCNILTAHIYGLFWGLKCFSSHVFRVFHLYILKLKNHWI